MDETKNLNILLKFALDSQAQARVKSGVSSIGDELDRARGKALEMQQALLQSSENAQRSFRDAAKIFASGTAITGGIFAVAERYVRNAKDANEITKEWTNQTGRLTQAQSRVGQVFAKEALPLLKTAADLASKAATFVEKNPEIIKAALNVGVAVASLGAVGMAVTKGIKLYADAKFVLVGLQQITAGKLMADAAKMQLAAAGAAKLGISGSGGLLAGAGGTAASGGAAAGSASGALLPIVTTVASLLLGSFLGTKLGNFGGKSIYGDQWQDKGFKESMKDVWETTRKIVLLASPLNLVSDAASKLGLISVETRAKIFDLEKRILGLGEASTKQSLGAKAGDPSGVLSGRITENEKEIVDSYVEMLIEEQRATEDYLRERNQIIRQANQQALQMGMSYSRSFRQSEERYNQQIADINEAYHASSVQAEQAYVDQRAQIVRDGEAAIQEIERNHQENLRRLTDEHNQRVADLVAGRDALGLVKEQRDFSKRKNELDREARMETDARRREIASRLADLARAHAQEKAQRLAAYKEQLKLAQQQHAEDQKQKAEAYREELRRMMQNKADTLRELDSQFKLELQRRREAFVSQVRDLDVGMQNEQKTKRAYYTAMLQDAEEFAKAYRDAMPSSGSGMNNSGFPIRDTGGYAERGVYGLAQDGRREFVLSGATTRAAEKAIGASLSQESIMRALNNKSQIVVYDHRRFDSRLTAEDRRAIQTDTMETLRGLIA